MTALSRRRFLGASATVLVAPGWLRVAGGAEASPPTPFLHGVASGDPLADRVVLWTRVTAPGEGAARVAWVVARDEGLVDVVRCGDAHTDGSRDWTVHVDVDGLEPGTTYHYGFTAYGQTSPVGRTRTTPVGSPDAVRLAVVTCGDYNRGLFHAYGRVAERDDLDAVVHLGDYIYEHGRQDRVRPVVPAHECRTVGDYRLRYASYRQDVHLAELHRRHPVIWVWDDHETCDGTWMHGADPSNHDPAEDGDFEARKAAALQAALEWLPVRLPDPGRPERIYRRFAFGDLVDLVMLDTRRIGRDRQGDGNVEGEFFRQTGEFADPARHILGAEQEGWLVDALTTSTAAWRLLGNQVVFSPIKLVGAPEATGASVYANPDQWDGYAPARARVVDAIVDEEVKDLVILTGDVHASMAFEVTTDPNNPAVYDPVTGRGSIGVEMVVPSISSAGDPTDPDDPEEVIERLVLEIDDALRVPNPHLKHIRAQLNGYGIVDVNAERVRAEYWTVPFVTQPTDAQTLDKAFVVNRGEPRLRDA